MTQDDAFLESIIESPDDDGLRLIYADWLEEQGDPRGEFIRVQIERARLPDDDPGQRVLKEREYELLVDYEDHWLRPFRGILDEGDCEWFFHRGFVHGVVFWGQEGTRRLLSHVEELFHRAPIRWLRLPPLGGEGAALHPWERRRLEVDRLSLTELRSLAALRQLSRLIFLDLSGIVLENTGGAPDFLITNAIGDAGADALAASPHLRGLRTLLLRDNVIGDAGALALVESPHLKQLTCLDLSGNRLNNGLIEELQRRLGDRVVL